MEYMNAKLRMKRLMLYLLIPVLIVMTIPFSQETWGIAYASTENQIDLQGKTENKFVQDVGFRTANGKTAANIKEYTFSPDTTEYDIMLLDSGTSAYLKVASNMVNPESETDRLYCSFYVDGLLKKMGNGPRASAQTKITTESTEIVGVLNVKNFPVGEQHKLSVLVGKINDEKEYIQYDVYNFNIGWELSFTAISAYDSNGDLLSLSPQYDLKANPYERNYTVTCGTPTLKLNFARVNDKATVAIGEKEVEVKYTSGMIKTPYYEAEINVNDYMDNNDKILLPILLKQGDLESKYFLYVVRPEECPVIEKQPQSASISKGEDYKLEVVAKTTQLGDLSYQWYMGEGTLTAIDGATESSYTPTIKYAGVYTYRCIVTNKVGEVLYATASKEATVTVQLSYLTAPEFVIQPRISADCNGGSRIFVENGVPEIEVGPITNHDKYIEDVEYALKLYRNSENTTEGGEEIKECVMSSSTTGSKNGKSYRQYTIQLPAQEVTGTYYYYVTATVSKDGLDSNTSVSETLPITFKSVKDVVQDLEGDGTEKAPFKIYNLEDLKYVKNLVEGKNGSAFNFAGQILQFAEDIELPSDWEPIGNLKEGSSENEGRGIQPFSGIIDGNNKTLTIAKDGKPLFNYVRKATVKNLNIFGEHINGYALVDKYTVDYGENGHYVNDPVRLRTIDIENVTIKKDTKVLRGGLIGGYASGANAVNIRNCTVEQDVVIGDDGTWNDAGNATYTYPYVGSLRYKDSVGSLVGAFNGTISNCISYATVYGGNSVGGLVGMKGQSMGPCSINNCAFLGKVIADGEKVGGIIGAGYISGSAPGTPVVQVRNSYVAAEISGSDKVGGIIGSEEGHFDYNDTGDTYGITGATSLTDNFFYGTLNCEGKSLGGIIGCLHDFTKIKGEATNYYLDSSKAEAGIGTVKSGEKKGEDRFSKPASAEEFANGIVLKWLNNTKTSNQNWELKDGAKFPTISKVPVVTSLSIEGEYQTEYVLGENLNLDGIEIYANWSDNTRTKLEIGKDKELTYDGYNKNKRGHQTITFHYKAIQATIGVTVLKEDDPDHPKTIDVRFTLLGDRIHNSDEDKDFHTLETGGLTPWYTDETYTVGINATVWNVLQEVEKRHSKQIKFHNQGNYIDYLYYDSTGMSNFDNETTKIGEFTNGNLSGWMYTLNGKHPNLGIEEQYLENGNRIVWHYTDDYTKEPDTKDWISSGGDTVEEVNSVTTDTKTGTTTAPTDVKVSEKSNADGTKEKVADVKVSADNQKEILKQVKEKKSNEIILVVSSKSVGDATKADVTLEKSFIDSIVKDTDAKLTIRTPFGDKAYTQEELKAMSDAATGSTITVTIEKAAEPADDAAVNIAKAKSIVKDMKLVARSSKTAKKNIKAVLKSDAKVKASIKELKDLGYTVKYRFYRSTKKAASYKSTVTKKAATYTNTAGKKGTKYFYKLQVRVYDENGKLVAKTALKQCKYASRVWSK